MAPSLVPIDVPSLAMLQLASSASQFNAGLLIADASASPSKLSPVLVVESSLCRALACSW
jgi:hypothetical protein